MLLTDEIGSSEQPLALALTAERRNRGIPGLGTFHAAHDAHRTRLPIPPEGWPPSRGRHRCYHGRGAAGKPERHRGSMTGRARSLPRERVQTIYLDSCKRSSGPLTLHRKEPRRTANPPRNVLRIGHVGVAKAAPKSRLLQHDHDRMEDKPHKRCIDKKPADS